MARPLPRYYPVKKSDLYKDKELWTKTSGCLIKDFRHDERSVTPEWALSLLLSVIPECMYQESILLKSIWIPD